MKSKLKRLAKRAVGKERGNGCSIKAGRVTWRRHGIERVDIRVVKTVKNADSRVLRKPVEIRKRWEKYFKELLNEEFPRREVQGEQPTEGPIPFWTQE
ncbi:unnamed protein product [Heligmosomoides polygyrus]|uniref:Endonuclease-reverse transcriptase n=1 Tax=Heligmosomoides polygyrus TaxID=6339 RepID=A0A183FN88_HELPZ|nr:unnamed protein product [Heligmosomoides polygyrus]